MKKVEMTIPELLNFRKEAMKANMRFFCQIMAGGTYMVEANIEFLEELGF